MKLLLHKINANGVYKRPRNIEFFSHFTLNKRDPAPLPRSPPAARTSWILLKRMRDKLPVNILHFELLLHRRIRHFVPPLFADPQSGTVKHQFAVFGQVKMHTKQDESCPSTENPSKIPKIGYDFNSCTIAPSRKGSIYRLSLVHFFENDRSEKKLSQIYGIRPED